MICIIVTHALSIQDKSHAVIHVIIVLSEYLKEPTLNDFVTRFTYMISLYTIGRVILDLLL